MEPHYRLARLLARILFNLFFIRPKVRGAEHLEGVKRPFLVVSNHGSNIDPALIWGYLPEPVIFLAKAELAKVPFVGWISRMVGNIHVKRDGQDAGSLRRALKTLKEDQGNLVVFLEGTRSPDGHLRGEAKPGAAMLASRTGVPVVPVFLEGTARVVPPGSLLPRLGEVTVHIGPPVPLDFRSNRPSGEELAEATRRIELAIDALDPDRVRREADPLGNPAG